ncbi:MAG: MFS transporter [Anaerolineales bacterium]|nr:MFS transporter [Anaerolineales bacterium]
MSEGNLKALRLQLTAFSITRTLINTGFRMVYPFLPTIARGLGVDVRSIALAITARSSLGLAAPYVGSLGDSIGRKRSMLLGLFTFSFGFMIVVIWPTYPGLFIALILGALGKIIFDPSMQAYLGDRTTYEQRGRAIAITELGWSGASLLGLPLVGWLIARSNWAAPFPLLAIFTFGMALWLMRLLPADKPAHKDRPRFSEALKSIVKHPSALAALTITLLISVSNESVNIVYGLWLEQAFGLQVAALGAASAVIGLAEFSGEGVVAGLTDRLGKRRSIIAGTLAITAACLVLPILGTSTAGALVGLFLFYLAFEFTFVSLIPMMTELVPTARATLLATNIAAAALGRALGALIGPFLYEYTLFANAVFGALVAALALVVLIMAVKEDGSE